MKKKKSSEKKESKTLAKLTDARRDQIDAYVEKGKKQSDFIKFETSKKRSGIAVDVIGVGSDDVEEAFERRAALYESTGMLQIAAGAQLLNQIASCEDLTDADEAVVALEKASCMMMELQPQDAFEGLLISQMVACQNQTMQCLKLAGKANLINHREMYFRFADRFMKTFTIQMGTLSKYRRGGQQKVVVEHVHVHEGGQAIVGNIENQRGGGGDENKR